MPPARGKEGLAGLRQFGFCCFVCCFGCLRGHCWCFQREEDDGRGFLDDFQALRQKWRVAVVQVDIVGGCPSGAEADCLSDYKSGCLGFRLPYRLGGGGAPLGPVQHLVTLC
jgi:hypothetical protein